MVEKQLCIVLADLIKKEENSKEDYHELVFQLEREGKLSSEIRNITRVFSSQHRMHAATLKKISSEIGCELYEEPTSDMILEREQYKLPVKERAERARRFLSRL